MILRQLARQLQQLASLDYASSSENGEAKEEASVYLITDRRDYYASEPLAAWLEEAGFKLLRPDNAQNTTDRKTHIEFLNSCDSAIIFYDKASHPWLVTKLQDILKAPGLGRTKGKGLNAVFTLNNESAEEINQIKEQFIQYKDIQILSTNGSFPEKVLQDFFGGLGEVELVQ